MPKVLDAAEVMAALQKPFDPLDIQWRIQQAGVKNGKAWALVLAYVTNRAIQDRLDNTVGIDKWHNQYEEAPDGGVMCGLSIRFGSEWITKWDGAENTKVEAVKGGLSGAMKRAAVQWGIGRYLYNLESKFVELSTDKNNGTQRYYDKDTKTTYYWQIPKIPSWAIPQEKEEA